MSLRKTSRPFSTETPTREKNGSGKRHPGRRSTFDGSDPGQLWISLEPHENRDPSDRDEKEIKLHVRDNGRGLPDRVNPDAPVSFGLQLVKNHDR